MLATHLLLALAASLASAATDYPQGGGACATIADCSLGGECVSSACVCDAWWTGERCDLLNLLNAASDAQGMQIPGYYSWGGHALADAAGTYHGFFSFMCRHATLSDWTTKSSIWHATAAAAEGPYALADMVAQPWSHNAMIAQTFDAAAPYVLYQLGDAATPAADWEPCYNSSEAAVVAAAAAAAAAGTEVRAAPALRGGGAANSNSLYVRSARSLSGPWSTLDGNNTPLVFTFDGSWATDTNGANPAPFFFANGTVLMYFSANPCPPNWGNTVPGNNCIGVARGDSWAGPFAALPLPVTHPESEDAHVFRDPRGNFHLLTNVNNDHARCAAGVPCGGHAWSTDGLSFSNLTIGAFGPYIRFANGSAWRTAYVERPQVTQATDGTPLAFFVGMSRASYEDSATWAQRFCPASAPAGACGPMLPPPAPPPALVTYALPRRGGLCLGTNASFPCPGGWANSCPVFLVPCDAPAARWLERADGLVESAAHAGNCLNRDCNSCAAGAAIKAAACAADGDAFAFTAGTLAAGGCGGACAGDGSAPLTPPCKAGEQTVAGQLSVQPCAGADAGGWVRTVVG